MIALWYLLGFIGGIFFSYAVYILISAKKRKNTSEDDTTAALTNIINY